MAVIGRRQAKIATAVLVLVGGTYALSSLIGCTRGGRAPEQPAIDVSVATLVDAYADDVARANATYGDKRLRVSGFVQGTGPWAFDLGLYLLLAEGPTSRGKVQCRFRKADKERLGQLRSGDPIAVVGKCKGLSLGKVILDRCDIVRP
jgi:hypothetical protein